MSPWIPWLYHYAVGGAVAGATLFIAWKAGAISLSRRLDRRLLAALVGGYVGFALIHALWIAGVLSP